MVEDLKPILQDPEVKGVVVASSALSHYSLVERDHVSG